MQDCDHPPDDETRRLILAALGGVLGLSLAGGAGAAPLDPAMTQITLPGQIRWKPWQKLDRRIGETAPLYGDVNQPGPYLVLMRWNPGFMSAPHSYRTDRLSVVLSGTWWVDSGAVFDPAHTVPVPAGSFVRRVARTPHFDGVKAGEKEPAIIALFGEGPVDLRLVDPSKPPYRALG